MINAPTDHAHILFAYNHRLRFRVSLSQKSGTFFYFELNSVLLKIFSVRCSDLNGKAVFVCLILSRSKTSLVSLIKYFTLSQDLSNQPSTPKLLLWLLCSRRAWNLLGWTTKIKPVNPCSAKNFIFSTDLFIQLAHTVNVFRRSLRCSAKCKFQQLNVKDCHTQLCTVHKTSATLPGSTWNWIKEKRKRRGEEEVWWKSGLWGFQVFSNKSDLGVSFVPSFYG